MQLQECKIVQPSYIGCMQLASSYKSKSTTIVLFSNCLLSTSKEVKIYENVKLLIQMFVITLCVQQQKTIICSLNRQVVNKTSKKDGLLISEKNSTIII